MEFLYLKFVNTGVFFSILSTKYLSGSNTLLKTNNFMGLSCWNENEAGESQSGLHGSPHVTSLRSHNDNFCGIFVSNLTNISIHCSLDILRFFGSRWRYRIVSATVL